jgi:hypothetical protein
MATMDKKRLLELAGVSTNMSNPSFEPETDVADNKVEIPIQLQLGDENEFGDSRDPEKKQEKMRRIMLKILPQLKAQAMMGLTADTVEEAHMAFKQILYLLGEKDKI